MKKLQSLSPLFVLLFISCSKEVDLSPEPNFLVAEIAGKEHGVRFIDNNPGHSELNSSSSSVIINRYAPSRVMGAKELYEKIDVRENCQGRCENHYELVPDWYEYFDFNNDEKPDLIGWYRNVGTNSVIKEDRFKFIVVDDIFGVARKIIQDTHREYYSHLEINDFNGDGIMEFIAFSNEDHNDWENPEVPVGAPKPIDLIMVDEKGIISSTPIGPRTSTHDLTTADIDNDGDIDIVNMEWFMMTEFNGPPRTRPIFYINDGDGNFSITKDLLILPEMFFEDSRSFIRATIDAYDLNNDGFMDLIMADQETVTDKYELEECWRFGDINGHCGYYDIPIGYGVQVVWGNEDGIFKYEESTFLDLDFNMTDRKMPLSFNFMDVNSDGNVDIISTGIEGIYTHGFIDVHLNNGDQTFTRAGNDLIDMNTWVAYDHGNYQNHIPLFYKVQIVDVDGDGLLDIRPTYSYEGVFYDNYLEEGLDFMGNNLYWKNIGGQFEFQDDIFTD